MDIYDVVLTEENIVCLVTYWKQIELKRALRLAEREQKNNPWCIVGIMKTGMAHIGLRINAERIKFNIPQYTMIDRKEVKTGMLEIEGLVFT